MYSSHLASSFSSFVIVIENAAHDALLCSKRFRSTVCLQKASGNVNYCGLMVLVYSTVSSYKIGSAAPIAESLYRNLEETSIVAIDGS